MKRVIVELGKWDVTVYKTSQLSERYLNLTFLYEK